MQPPEFAGKALQKSSGLHVTSKIFYCTILSKLHGWMCHLKKNPVVNKIWVSFVLPSISQKMILGIKGQKKTKQETTAIPPSQTQAILNLSEHFPSFRCRGQSQRQRSMFPERLPSDGSRVYISLHMHFLVLSLVEDNHWLPGRHGITWNWEMEQWSSSELKKPLPKTSTPFMKRLHCLETFHQENLENVMSMC